MDGRHFEGQQPGNQTKPYCHCLPYVTVTVSLQTTERVSRDGCSVTTHATQRARHSLMVDIAAQLLQSTLKMCACRRRLAGAWPRAFCIIVAIETWIIARKETGCMNTLLISYGICRHVCDRSKWWARISVGEISTQLNAGDTGIVISTLWCRQLAQHSNGAQLLSILIHPLAHLATLDLIILALLIPLRMRRTIDFVQWQY